MLSPIFGDKLYLNLVYFSCTWWFSIQLLSSVFTWISVQKSDNQFCVQNRFTLICVPCWCVECYKCLYCTFPKEDSHTLGDPYFYKRKIRIAAICLGLQNALNISDNSSIYNYYGTNKVIIVQFATIMQ